MNRRLADLVRNRIAKRLVLAAFLSAPMIGIGLSQDKLPRFETSSIRTLAPNQMVMTDPDTPTVLPGAGYRDPSTILLFLIAFAYDVQNPSLNLVGLPKWADQKDFSITAKAGPEFAGLPAAENRETVRLMLRALLEDRFHLKIHTEERDTKVLNLQIAKGGLKVSEVAAPEPPAKEGRVEMGVGDRGGRIVSTKATVRGLASSLTVFLKQPIVDQTRLGGYYDFNATWTAIPQDGAPAPAAGLGSDGLALLISNLEQKFGLVLRSGVGKSKYWVVDSVEIPDEN